MLTMNCRPVAHFTPGEGRIPDRSTPGVAAGGLCNSLCFSSFVAVRCPALLELDLRTKRTEEWSNNKMAFKRSRKKKKYPENRNRIVEKPETDWFKAYQSHCLRFSSIYIKQ